MTDPIKAPGQAAEAVDVPDAGAVDDAARAEESSPLNAAWLSARSLLQGAQVGFDAG